MTFLSRLKQIGTVRAAGAPRISADTFRKQHRPGDVVVDVRTRQEFESGHLPEAEHIDMMSPDFQNRIEQLDRDGTYYLYCRTGSRSGRAADLMARAGFERVYNIGGIGEHV
jgi:phage shock protein E